MMVFWNGICQQPFIQFWQLQMPSVPSRSILPSYVKMKKQPFYDEKQTFLWSFYLSPVFSYQRSYRFVADQETARAVTKDDNKILLRFCLMDLSGEQDDKFPPELKVLVNGIELDTKGGPFPMDITALCKITCDALNLIQVSSIGLGNYYVISVSLVKKLTVSNLIEKLKTKKPLTMQDTQTLIKKQLRGERLSEDTTATIIQCSLMCPLSMTRIVVPCRATSCHHIQVFDAIVYFRVNELKSNWICPVCNSPALFPSLVIDGYFQKVLEEAQTCTRVSLKEDGTWTPVLVGDQQDESEKSQRITKKRAIEVITIDSDDEDQCAGKEFGSTEQKEMDHGSEAQTALSSSKRCRGETQPLASVNNLAAKKKRRKRQRKRW